MFTVRVQRDDFEQALSKFAGKPVAAAHPDILASVALTYLRKSITVRSNGQLKNLEWGGLDTDGAHLLIYLESSLPEGIYGVRLTDRVLQEIFADEINALTVRVGALKQTLVFGNDTDELAINLRDLPRPKFPH